MGGSEDAGTQGRGAHCRVACDRPAAAGRLSTCCRHEMQARELGLCFLGQEAGMLGRPVSDLLGTLRTDVRGRNWK